MHQGVIVAYNARRGLFAVQGLCGDCSVYRLTSGNAIAIGHRVVGNLDSSLTEALHNLDTDERVSVDPQALGCRPHDARRLIR